VKKVSIVSVNIYDVLNHSFEDRYWNYEVAVQKQQTALITGDNVELSFVKLVIFNYYKLSSTLTEVISGFPQSLLKISEILL
jgi:hypothetical protein